jgi:hypothetical protein
MVLSGAIGGSRGAGIEFGGRIAIGRIAREVGEKVKGKVRNSSPTQPLWIEIKANGFLVFQSTTEV